MQKSFDTVVLLMRWDSWEVSISRDVFSVFNYYSHLLHILRTTTSITIPTNLMISNYSHFLIEGA